ncbi:hypothetical protein M885DRAFT_476162 [Pelagophyceae sp. CCMP2097]|nr:hypothetical protein M885DRAFT_476162 [Pelagophyceae sp. CCMP2097]
MVAFSARTGCAVFEGRSCTLAGARSGPSVPRPAGLGAAAAAFPGDMASFLSGKGAEAASQCTNSVRKCNACGKVCAANAAQCNGCGVSLRDVAVTSTHNVFTGFAAGVASGPFPFKMSLRSEDEETLVFDDPLAITQAHVCAVPTDVYCATALELFEQPKRGLALVERLENAAWDAVRWNFLADKAWRGKTLGGSVAVDDLRGLVAAGFNVPPSQFQLHLQYMLPPLLPAQYRLFRQGAHFTHDRFLPLAYVKQALAQLVEKGAAVAGARGLSVPELAARVQALTGVDYAAAHADAYSAVEAAQQRLGNYDAGDFDFLVDDETNTAVARIIEGAPQPLEGGALAGADLAKSDTLALQQYGRPYDAQGKPTGVFYSHARDIPLPQF